MTNGNSAKNLRIGFTERGDGGLDTSWFEKAGTVDGVSVVTKNVTVNCAERLLELARRGYPVLLHAGCTGWGGTCVEPRVPTAEVQVQSVRKLIDCGFDPAHVTLRIDPVIPTPEGLDRARRVIALARSHGLLPGLRVRLSVLDDYKHVKERFRALGLEPVYPEGQFHASTEQFMAVEQIIRDNPDVRFETCAEPFMAVLPNCERLGCLSRRDLDVMGLEYDKDFVNPQGRGGCLCLGAKTELLTHKHRCPHQCAYCYWRD